MVEHHDLIIAVGEMAPHMELRSVAAREGPMVGMHMYVSKRADDGNILYAGARWFSAGSLRELGRMSLRICLGLLDGW